MMMNLFTVFDPSTSFLPNWAIPLSIMLLWTNFWMTNTPLLTIMKLLNSLLIKELKILINKKTTLLILPLFMLIFMMNLYGQFPYNFPITSHLSFTLSMGLPFWMSSIIKSIHKSLNLFFHNLIPSGTPLLLMPLMVIIEFTSILIQPITLSVRLMANITSGHLMMMFISSLNINFMMTSLISPIQSIYLILEIFISFIQAYIFILLISLYNSN